MVLFENFTHDDWHEFHYRMQPYKNIEACIWRYGSYTVLALGLSGNGMIIVIVWRLPASTSNVFFQALAWSDTLLLMISPFSLLLQIDLYLPVMGSLGSWQCKFYHVLSYLPTALSAWLLVVMTMLRAASVLWPLRLNSVWTIRKSRIAVGVMVVLSFLIHSHFFYGFDVGPCYVSSITCCPEAVSATYWWFFNDVWQWISQVESNFLPFVILVVGNGVLLGSLFKSVRMGKRLSAQQKATQESFQQKVSSLTVTLIAANVSFILLTTPFMVYNNLFRYIVDWEDPVQNGLSKVFRATSNVLMFSNSSINFYMYCLPGSKFRTELKKMLC